MDRAGDNRAPFHQSVVLAYIAREAWATLELRILSYGLPAAYCSTMPARVLLNLVHALMIEHHGPDEVDVMLAEPDPEADARERMAQVVAMGGQILA